MACNYYYNSNAIPGVNANVVDKNWIAYHGGIDPATSTPEQLAEAGFYCYQQTSPPDINPQIYTLESQFVIDGTNATTEYTVVALPLSNSKATYTETVKAKAYSILEPTDWLVVRSLENGAAVPTDWNDWRESVRVESQTKVAAIEGCATADDLEDYVTSDAYDYWPAEPTAPTT